VEISHPVGIPAAIPICESDQSCQQEKINVNWVEIAATESF